MLGARFHWLRHWLIGKSRVGVECDALVWGANPILGALAAASLARAGKTVLLAPSREKDPWDYAITLRGVHDDLFKEAGLPKMSMDWFTEMARHGNGRLAMLWGYRPIFHKEGFCLLRPEIAEESIGSQRKLSEMLKSAFRNLKKIEPGMERHAEGKKEVVVFAKEMILVSDLKDGAEHEQREFCCEMISRKGEVRMGSGQWASGNALTFAEKSRRDIEAALTDGGWTAWKK